MSMRFEKCPNCGNNQNGFTVCQCKECGGFWCYKSQTFSSDEGCGAASNKCPHCSKYKSVGLFSSSFRTAGYIENNKDK
jgi:hypothetical protein